MGFERDLVVAAYQESDDEDESGGYKEPTFLGTAAAAAFLGAAFFAATFAFVAGVVPVTV